ncbi:MAG: hypothetical protein ACREQ5_14595, partial [Candidatus Dormibacteria bacterium]
ITNNTITPEAQADAIQAIFADKRTNVVCWLAELLPLPLKEAVLPPIYAIDSVSVSNDLHRIAAEYPAWMKLVTNPYYLVRLTVIKRILKTSVLYPLIILALDDTDARVRRVAASTLGLKLSRHTTYDHKPRLKLAEAIKLVMSADDETLVRMSTDLRPTVRHAIACRVASDSDLLAVLAADNSPRVRRAVAARLVLDSPAITALANDPTSSVSQIVQRRRKKELACDDGVCYSSDTVDLDGITRSVEHE